MDVDRLSAVGDRAKARNRSGLTESAQSTTAPPLILHSYGKPFLEEMQMLAAMHLTTKSEIRDAVGMLKLYGQVNNYADQSTGGTTGGNRRSRISSEECDVAAEM